MVQVQPPKVIDMQIYKFTLFDTGLKKEKTDINDRSKNSAVM